MTLISFSINAANILPHHQQVKCRQNIGVEKVRNLVKITGVPSLGSPPQTSLQNGNWVKLICGASFEDVVDIRNFSLVYTLAGVDCIDCAADEAVVNAVNEGVEAAGDIVDFRRPWIMISVNDDEDLHFRKAEFDPEACPRDCSRPCETICPANAISSNEEKSRTKFTNQLHLEKGGGVITERCYGCGRCFPVCPYDKIRFVNYVRDAAATTNLLKRSDVDAMEIHTSGRHIGPFQDLWDGIASAINCLKLVAVSLPYVGDSTTCIMNSIYSTMEPHLKCPNLWQLDGRPMSGDIGRGATRETITFANHLAFAKDKPPGFLQLAGGTNLHTVDGLKKKGLFKTVMACDSNHNEGMPASPSQPCALVGGVAYGGYARKIVGRVLRSIPLNSGLARIEDYPEHLLEAVREALNLVATVKSYKLPP